MTDKFRLPRKLKKRLRKGFWLYPADEKGNSQMAFPFRSKEDYEALKGGIVTNFFNKTKEENQKSKEELNALNSEIFVSDEKLKDYVNDIFAKQYRLTSYNILLQSKNHPKAQKGYFNFVNAYHKYIEDDSFGAICCLSVDLARDLLKPNAKKKRKRRR